MRAKVALFLILLSTLVPSVGLAQSPPSKNPNYVGVTAGIVSAKYMRGELSTTDQSSDHLNFSDLELSRGELLGIKVGRTKAQPRAFAAIELEGLAINGTDVETHNYFRDTDNADVDADVDVSVKAVMVNVFLRNPYGKVHPYGGFGLGWAWLDMDMVLTRRAGFVWPGTGTTAGTLGGLSDSDYAIQVLLGMDWDMTEAFGMDLGYRYFQTQADVAGSIGTSDFDLETIYKTHMLAIGLEYRF